MKMIVMVVIRADDGDLVMLIVVAGAGGNSQFGRED